MCYIIEFLQNGIVKAIVVSWVHRVLRVSLLRLDSLCGERRTIASGVVCVCVCVCVYLSNLLLFLLRMLVPS